MSVALTITPSRTSFSNPCCSTVTRVGSNAQQRELRAAAVIGFYAKLLAGPCIQPVTFAPGTLAPLASVTVTSIPPVVPWPNADAAATSRASERRNKTSESKFLDSRRLNILNLL